MLQIVDDREKEREELCKKRLNLMKHHIEEQLKELKMKDSFLNKIREQRLRKERVRRLMVETVTNEFVFVVTSLMVLNAVQLRRVG